MSQPIPATPPCAAHCSRIDLIPVATCGRALVRVACARLRCRPDPAWRCRGAATRSKSGGTATGNPLRPLIRPARRITVRCGAIEWSEEGESGVRLGPQLTPHPATLAAGSFRLGVRYWVLRFMTPAGCGRYLSQAAFRTTRVSAPVGCLTTHLRRASGARGAPLLPSGPRFEVRHAPLKIIRLDRVRKETFAGVQGLFSSQGAGVLL